MRSFLFVLFVMCTNAYSQVGIGTTNPNNSSVLDLTSSNKGVLIPRMTEIQRDAITLPASGLMIYNLTSNYIEVNSGSPASPFWYSVGGASSIIVYNKDDSGFKDRYVDGVALTVANKFNVTIKNNSSGSIDINLAIGDLVLSGVGGMSVLSVSPSTATLLPGESQLVEYRLTGTPASIGTLTGDWTNSTLSYTHTVTVVKGDAFFTIPSTVVIASTNDVSPVIDIQGVIDNTSNQYTVNIPYTGGLGIYDAYSGTFVLNNVGTGEGGDANSFRLTYPSGTFSSTGSIIATIEVDGDGSFDAEKQLYGVQKNIAALDFQVNGESEGSINLDVIGGIIDRNYADDDHKFIYLPVAAANGSIWLNNNLGANYSNVNHEHYNPSKQATAFNDFNAYGSIYQWGRFSDGHELINYTDSTVGVSVNGVTSVNATSDTPGNSLYITETVVPNDWRDPQNHNLWQGEAGINNPCPEGFRVPTETEWNTFIAAEGITNKYDATSSSLSLTSQGLRDYSTGNISFVGVDILNWTSTVNAVIYSVRVGFLESSIGMNTNRRSYGFGVRCIQD